MRIVLTIDFSPWSPYSGGAQRSTDRLARALAARSHRVDVVYTRPPWERFALPQDLPYAVHWAALPALRSHRAAPLRPLSGLAVRRVVARLLDPAAPTIVHANGEEGAFLAALRHQRRLALIASPRHPGYLPAFDAGWPRGLSQVGVALVGAKYLAQGAVARAADRVCPPSAYAGELCVRAFGVDPVRVEAIHNGVDPAFAAARRREGAADGHVVFFGRLEEDKGVLDLVDAWERLPGPLPRLVLVGRGALEGPLRARLAALPADRPAELRGWTSSAALADLLAGAALCVLPSRRESFGNAIAEALAAGAPVLSCRCASIPELVVHGERGWLVPPAAPQALADAIARLLADAPLRERLAAAGAAWAREHLTWDDAARRFESVYERALAVASRAWPRGQH